jgi:PAS domain S-box-containing protein
VEVGAESMPNASSYSFIDVAALDGIRERFAAGDSLAVLSADLETLIWANGPGARLFGFDDVEDAAGSASGLPGAARRQIMATPGYPDVPRDRTVAVRLADGLASRSFLFQARSVRLPDGETALLLALPAAAPDGREADIVRQAVTGFGRPGHLVAFLDGAGSVEAATPGFAGLDLPASALRGLIEDADRAGGIAKRIVDRARAPVPAGLARLRESPPRYLLVVVDEPAGDAVSEQPASPDRPTARQEPAEPVVLNLTGEPDRPADDAGQSDGPRAAPAHALADDVPTPADDTADLFSAPPTDDRLAATSDEPAWAPPEPDAPAGPFDFTTRPATTAPATEPERASAPIRFVWKTDAEGRFSSVSPEFVNAVGATGVVVGRHFRDVAEALKLDPYGEIAGLLERRDTWSGRSVFWPIAGTDLTVPVDLAALPVYDRSRQFEGFRGFGVARMADAIVDPDALGLAAGAPDAAPVDGNDATLPDDPFQGETPALVREPGPDRRRSDRVIQLAEHRPQVAERTLSSVEAAAFKEIAARLRGASTDTGPAIETVPVAPEPSATTPQAPVEPPAEPSAPSYETIVAAEIAGEADAGSDDAAPLPGEAASVPSPDAPVEVQDHAEARLEADLPEVPVAEDADPDVVEPEGDILQLAPSDVGPADADEASAAEPDGGFPQPDADATEAAAAARETPQDIPPPRRPVQLPRQPDAVSISIDTLPPAAARAPQAVAAARDSAVPFEAVPRPTTAELKVDGFLPSAFSGPSTAVRKPFQETAILSRLPVPILIHAGDALHYANEEFLSLTGYEDVDQLSDAGGLDALFPETIADEEPGQEGRTISLRTRAGEQFPIEALLRAVPWDGGRALMLIVRRTGDDERPVEAVAAAPPRPALVVPVRPEPAQAEAAPDTSDLKARLAEMRTIIDTATDGVVLINRNGLIRSISRPAEALFGVETDDVEGKPFVSLFAMESQRAARDYLSGLSDHGVASVLNDGREVIGKEAQGRFIPLFMTIGRLPDDGGYCAVLRDITQWKRAEEELTQARAVAERSSSHKTEFLARVSHEIRTPLNAIIGFSELMVDERFGPIGNDRYRDYLRDINRSGNHVLDLVNDLLDISKIEAGEQEMAYEAVSLNEALSETVAMMQPQANRERVIIRSSFASGLPDVVADRRSVRQIALNLLSNAIRFTQAGGQVIVSTAFELSGEVVIRVRDTGVGMSQAEIEQALKPFKQLNAFKRQRGDGTGLGLPLTKAMVEANRARFVISSTPGEGTLVEVSFPSTRVLAQ